jgi:hypothetical protein
MNMILPRKVLHQLKEYLGASGQNAEQVGSACSPKMTFATLEMTAKRQWSSKNAAKMCVSPGRRLENRTTNDSTSNLKSLLDIPRNHRESGAVPQTALR